MCQACCSRPVVFRNRPRKRHDRSSVDVTRRTDCRAWGEVGYFGLLVSPRIASPRGAHVISIGCRRWRHVHGPAACARKNRPDLVGQGSFDTGRSVDRRAERHQARVRAGGHRPEPDRPRDARHYGGNEHRAHRNRCALWSRHDQGVSSGAADRTLLRAGRSRWLDHLQQVAADGAARVHHRS